MGTAFSFQAMKKVIILGAAFWDINAFKNLKIGIQFLRIFFP